MKRVGIIGCGSISRVHAWSLGQISDCKITALCDIVPDAAKKLAAEYGLEDAAVYDSYEQLIDDGSVDVVHICTPHYLHVPMAVAALGKGISVFMEKPAAISIGQFRELEAAEKLSTGSVGVCFQNRYNEATRELDRLAESGEYGAVQGARAFVTWRRDAEYYKGNALKEERRETPTPKVECERVITSEEERRETPTPKVERVDITAWKGKWETEGGGALINQSIHTLDLMLRYLGTPDRVEAGIANHHTGEDIEVEDTVEAWLEFPGGKRGCFYASNAYAADAPNILELQCEKGRLMLTGRHIIINRDDGLRTISCNEPAGIGKSYWGGGHLRCISDFYGCLNNGKAFFDRTFGNGLMGVKNTMETTFKIYGKY